MKKFQFSLEKVLEVRQQAERNAKLDYGELQKLVSQKELLIQKMITEKTQLMDTNRIGIEQLQVYYRYLAFVDQQLMEEHQRLLELKSHLQEKLDEYVLAQKNRKVLENLRGKKEEEYLAQLSKEEQKQLDEFRVVKFA